MHKWFAATVAETAPGRSTLLQLALNVPHELASTFQTPGQYHRVRIDHDENPFAIASPPGQARFEYLVKRSPGLAARWASLEPGAQVMVSLPHGPGFPLARARGRALVLVATGAGFAPVRSVIEVIAHDRAAYGPVHALVGLRSQKDLAWEADLARWAACGIVVEHVVSSPDGHWSGRVGRVQEHLDILHLGDTVVFLCGQHEMIVDLRAAFGRRGMSKDRVFLNLPT